MYYYKHIESNYIIGLMEVDTPILHENLISISPIEHDKIKVIIDNKPEDTETHYYMLRADTLEYEAIERPEPVPIPEPTYTLDEAATLLAQEVSQ